MFIFDKVLFMGKSIKKKIIITIAYILGFTVRLVRVG